MRLSTSCSPSRARPPRSPSSSRKPRPTTTPPEPLDQPARRGGGAAGGEHVVDHEHPLARKHGVAVDLELVGAVLELVLLAGHGPRQLARLAHGHEPSAAAGTPPARQDEAPRLDADHAIDGDAGEAVHEVVDRQPERRGVAEQRCDVAEGDARLGVVGDVSDVVA